MVNNVEYQKEYRLKHKRELARKKRLYYLKHKAHSNEKSKLYRLSHKEEIKRYRQLHRQEFNEYNKIYLRIYRKTKMSLNCKLGIRIRKRIWAVLKTNKKSFATEKLLGCSIEQLKQHLENRFKKGMNWANYGKWEIDHIRPCASFDLSKTEEQLKCFHYSNLRPLWKHENRRKGIEQGGKYGE